MPVAEITVQYVNFAKPGKKFGSVKSSEGNYYWGPDNLLHAFQQGEVCKIEYSENNGFNSIGKKLGSTKAPPLTPPPVPIVPKPAPKPEAPKAAPKE